MKTALLLTGILFTQLAFADVKILTRHPIVEQLVEVTLDSNNCPVIGEDIAIGTVQCNFQNWMLGAEPNGSGVIGSTMPILGSLYYARVASNTGVGRTVLSIEVHSSSKGKAAIQELRDAIAGGKDVTVRLVYQGPELKPH
jgi:hypothetical protein